MSEFAPPGSNARMTKAQMKKWLKDMKIAQEIANKKLEEARINGEFEKEAEEVAKLEKELDNFYV